MDFTLLLNSLHQFLNRTAKEADIGEHAASGQRLQQALDIFGSLGTRWQLGRTHFEWGELAAAQADVVTARDHFAQAQRFFEAMQAAPDLARTHEALTALT